MYFPTCVIKEAANMGFHILSSSALCQFRVELVKRILLSFSPILIFESFLLYQYMYMVLSIKYNKMLVFIYNIYS